MSKCAKIKCKKYLVYIYIYIYIYINYLIFRQFYCNTFICRISRGIILHKKVIQLHFKKMAMIFVCDLVILKNQFFQKLILPFVTLQII